MSLRIHTTFTNMVQILLSHEYFYFANFLGTRLNIRRFILRIKFDLSSERTSRKFQVEIDKIFLLKMRQKATSLISEVKLGTEVRKHLETRESLEKGAEIF